MKRLYGFIFILMAVLLLSGCSTKIHYGLEVSKDGEVTANIITAYDDEMIDAMIDIANGNMDLTSENRENEEHTDKERWEYIEKNSEESTFKDYKREKYDKDGFKGYSYKETLGKIDDLLVKDKDEKASMDAMNKDSKIFIKEGNTYKISITSGESTSAETTKQYEEYGAVFDAKFTVKLPNEAKKNNATSVDGTTYTWDLLKAQKIELEFELTGGTNMLPIYIAIGAAALVCCVFVPLVVVKNKKNKKEIVNTQE